MGGLKYFFRRPVSRNEWERAEQLNESRHEEWLELFGDLILVAALLKIGDSLHYCLDVSDLLRAAVWVTLLWTTRMGLDQYTNRAYTDDLVHKMIYIVHYVGVFIMVLNFSVDAERCAPDVHHGAGIAAGYIIARGTLVILHTVFMIYVEKARLAYSRYMVCWGVVMLLNAVAIGINQRAVYEWIFVSCAILEVLPIYNPKRDSGSEDGHRRIIFPINLNHSTARQGALIMITLGESVIQLLIQTLRVQAEVRQYLFVILGFLLITSLALQFFDTVPHEVRNHAGRKSTVNGSFWFFSHLPLTYFLFIIGLSLKLLLETMIANSIHEDDHADDDQGDDHRRLFSSSSSSSFLSPNPAEARALGESEGSQRFGFETYSRMLSASTATCMFLFMVLRYAHKGLPFKKRNRTVAFGLRCVAMVLHAVIVVLPPEDEVGVLAEHTTVAWLSVLVDVASHRRLDTRSRSLSDRDKYTDEAHQVCDVDYGLDSDDEDDSIFRKSIRAAKNVGNKALTVSRRGLTALYHHGRDHNKKDDGDDPQDSSTPTAGGDSNVKDVELFAPSATKPAQDPNALAHIRPPEQQL